MKLMGRHSRWPRRFLGLAARAVGAQVRVAGEPRCADVFFIANHVSWIDILALGGATGTAFVAHDGIERWPVVGWLAAQNNTIFVARSRRQDIGGQLDRLRAALSGHQPVALFPEGTTSDGSGLLPFKPSLLAGLMPPPRAVMIQPVHIDYGAATGQIAWHGAEPAGANAARLLARPGPLVVTLHFLDPFDPAELADRKALAAQAHRKIALSIDRQQAASAAHGAPV
ncbi:lysophospholipid acyltransferase family protein [Sphingobium sp. AN641]|uniref:lysophospholipid acyltransferase family protein n=1 Tax=Sphingobium sp. AN641 TaxID=3133443 RepID=UPI0030BF0216